MKNIFFALFFSIFSYAQNSNSAYGASKPIKTNLSETINEIERNDFRYREQKRKNKRSKKGFTTNGEKILIYGGENSEVFLGCLNCDKFDKESIWNTMGDFGSVFGQFSIWNKFREYGGQMGNYSPFNQFSKKPPILVDSNGNKYGYFSVDSFYKQSTDLKLAIYIVENWETISEDVNSAYVDIFE